MESAVQSEAPVHARFLRSSPFLSHPMRLLIRPGRELIQNRGIRLKYHGSGWPRKVDRIGGW